MAKEVSIWVKKGVKITPGFRRDKVESSQITEIALDVMSGILYILFYNNSIYAYTPFDVASYEKFLNSPSVGSYFFKNIKKNNKITFKAL